MMLRFSQVGEADTACLAVMGEIQGRLETFPNKQILVFIDYGRGTTQANLNILSVYRLWERSRAGAKHLPTSKFEHFECLSRLFTKYFEHFNVYPDFSQNILGLEVLWVKANNRGMKPAGELYHHKKMISHHDILITILLHAGRGRS